MAVAGRSVVDKAVAIVFPISAFVAAGFEHSVANLYLIPMAMLIEATADARAAAPILWSGLLANMVAVVLGNIVGGSLFVGVVFHVIYRRPAARG